MSRLTGDMKRFVVLGVYRSTVKIQNKEKNTDMGGGRWRRMCLGRLWMYFFFNPGRVDRIRNS